MEINSPRPEHFQLNSSGFPKADIMLNTLNKRLQVANDEITNSLRNLNEGNSSSYIDNLLEDRSIPSPPQSPKLVNIGSFELNNIKVLPSWQNGLTVKRYRYSTNNFFNGYRIFKTDNSNKSNTIASHSNISRNKKIYKNNSGSDIERQYRTRRAVRESGKLQEPSEIIKTKKEVKITKPRSPTFKRPNSASTTSPLASASVLSGNSTYTPNMSWEKLPDYSPSVNSLPENNVKCLKVEWKGSPMDLSHDPLSHLLHPSELILAQVLRLPCDLYLDSKRRFFLEKVYRYKKGLPFRRTDAQKACRIDVNKASRLFAAFEKVGWLQDKYFTKY